jgi:hypothetical protein
VRQDREDYRHDGGRQRHDRLIRQMATAIEVRYSGYKTLPHDIATRQTRRSSAASKNHKRGAAP